MGGQKWKALSAGAKAPYEKARKEARKNSGAPSRPQNAYWLWLSDNRKALEKEAGSAVGPVVGKLAGQKWKALSAGAKAPYEKKAAALKAEYEKALEEWKKTAPA